MTIKIKNDGKEKEMSFEATIEDVFISEPMFFGSAQAAGYGATETEARENLSECLKRIAEKVSAK